MRVLFLTIVKTVSTGTHKTVYYTVYYTTTFEQMLSVFDVVLKQKVLLVSLNTVLKWNKGIEFFPQTLIY